MMDASQRKSVNRTPETDPAWLEPAREGDRCAAVVETSRTAVRCCSRAADYRVVWEGVPPMPLCAEHFEQSGIEAEPVRAGRTPARR